MDQADVLVLRHATWETEYLEDIALRRLVLDLYDSEHVPLRRYLSFLGVDVETGRELLQEAFLKLHLHLLDDGDRGNLRAWLYRVAHNLARNSQVVHSASRTDYLPDLNTSGDLPSTSDSAEERMISAERVRLFQEGLSQLSFAQRECLLLRSRGLKYREIAQTLDISVSTVGENVQRGLERLRALVAV